jgi:hypothetical protein
MGNTCGFIIMNMRVVYIQVIRVKSCFIGFARSGGRAGEASPAMDEQR